jgi:hypothetical protein
MDSVVFVYFAKREDGLKPLMATTSKDHVVVFGNWVSEQMRSGIDLMNSEGILSFQYKEVPLVE